jgi:hypothetical protein
MNACIAENPLCHAAAAAACSNATRERLTVGGHAVYAAFFEGRQGYRVDNTSGIAKGNEEETLYVVVSGTHYNGGAHGAAAVLLVDALPRSQYLVCSPRAALNFSPLCARVVCARAAFYL